MTGRDERLPAPADGSRYQTYQPALLAALSEFQAAVVRESTLDPVTTELIRIRCAHVHDCRVCKSVRLEPARAAGADEPVLAQVEHYETSTLSERHKVVLRLADAHLFGSVPPTLPPQVAAELTAREAVDVVLLVAKCSYQKSLVALGLDAPRGYTYFEWDQQTGDLVRLDESRATV
jgi:AhpD family alkylhydroperoxidase